ncbi:hypothetical protein GALL_395460 [mine drainage metagenome]|uniref:Uncharacterized protein n=1 Tax=mine drainage metagenome TaxID=410659 RepID=A0A1J5QS48_9ZZZZ
MHVGDRLHHPHRTGADLLSDGATGDQHRTLALECIAMFGPLRPARFHRFRPCLQDIEVAVDAVLAPFDVHRTAVVPFDGHGKTRQLLRFGVSQTVAVAQFRRRIPCLHQMLRTRWRELHADQLGPEVAADHRLSTSLQRGFEYVELVRIDRPLHHGFAKTVGRGDEHHIGKAGLGIECEHHARHRLVAAHHALHPGRQGDVAMDEALVHAIGDGAVVVERGKHMSDLVEHGLDAADIEIGFLLSGERGVRQVFRRCGGAHRERRIRVAGGQRGIRSADGLLEVGRKGRVDNPLADLFANLRQGAHVVRIQGGQRRFDAPLQPAGAQDFAEGMRRGAKPARHAHSGSGELADHFAQRSILAADLVDIAHSHIVQFQNEFLPGMGLHLCIHGGKSSIE